MGADQELKAKYKECGVVYMANSKNGTGSMRRHMQSCVRRDTRDVGQLLMSQDKGTLALSVKRFDAEHFRELITIAIILHDLPFSFVEYEAIRATYQYLHPEITLVTRNTLKADVQKMYSREKARIKSMLELSHGRICLTSDLWTSIVTDGYLSLTAHFIDKDWVLQKRLLNFYFMPSPHTGIALSEKLYALLCEWRIEYKVFTLTLKNASANYVSVDLLKNQLIENNALISDVQEGLKDSDSVVKKIRESVKYVRGSQIRKKKFLECVKLVGLDSKRELSDSNYKDCPDPYEWEKKSETSEDAYFSAMAKAMLTKFEKYWKDFSLILAIAIVLDPRYKLNFVDYAYGNVYGMKGSPQFLEVKRNLELLFTEYSKGKEFNNFESQEQTVMHKSELEVYLDEPRVQGSVELDVLEFWKGNQFRYPELSYMARDILKNNKLIREAMDEITEDVFSLDINEPTTGSSQNSHNLNTSNAMEVFFCEWMMEKCLYLSGYNSFVYGIVCATTNATEFL
ncbi:zinc finger BED domain-containing protein DAYSLEEPER-like [Morus notabilis]|uniref:zinc finger BED domain-containing protein DAYSLEEPER-like n=1 Tax=Morus notabilis TaxID=981085 RepID=UPI000CECF7EE|nr:zinc finger BED domain-containing protein DAYSLEEPER-like [Morus notabilis]